MSNWVNPANLLSALRLALVPLLLRALLARQYTAALALFLLAAFTDFLDGMLARHFGWITRAGAYLDPIADKLLLSAVYLSLAIIKTLPWWFVGLIFARDLLILASSGAALCFTRLRSFPPTHWGKMSTFFQILTACVWMGVNVFPQAWIHGLALGLIWPTAIVTFWSGLHYGWRGLRLVRTH